MLVFCGEVIALWKFGAIVFKTSGQDGMDGTARCVA
jgi:hypothetical protein